MREIHIHVEEPSMEAFLTNLLPKILPAGISWRVIDHGSKWQLFRRVPARLVGYAGTPEAYRPKILILVDRDDDDCLLLKARLDEACCEAALITKSVALNGTFDVVNRIVVEELEAWYFGDIDAVTANWPGVPRTIGRRARYRHPDAINGTHEAFLVVLQQAGHLKGAGRLPKIDTARRMGASIEPDRNQSPSFQQFLTGLNALVEAA